MRIRSCYEPPIMSISARPALIQDAADRRLGNTAGRLLVKLDRFDQVANVAANPGVKCCKHLGAGAADKDGAFTVVLPHDPEQAITHWVSRRVVSYKCSCGH